jgi:ATP-dependent protease ClpP protease subunit
MPAAYISFSNVVNQVTTENLLGLLAQQMNSGIDEVHLALSTPGGSVMNGLTAYNIMRALPLKLITYNVGSVNSIGNVLFLAGEERYACGVSSFMFHGVGFDVNAGMRFEEKVLRERLDSILNDQQRIGEVIRHRTSIDAREVKRLFLQAATKDSTYALQKGIINAVREFQVPKGAQLFQLVFKG